MYTTASTGSIRRSAAAAAVTAGLKCPPLTAPSVMISAQHEALNSSHDGEVRSELRLGASRDVENHDAGDKEDQKNVPTAR